MTFRSPGLKLFDGVSPIYRYTRVVSPIFKKISNYVFLVNCKFDIIINIYVTFMILILCCNHNNYMYLSKSKTN